MLKKIKHIGRWDLTAAVWMLLKWLVLATFIGVLVGLIGALFGHTLIWVNKLRALYPFIIFGLPLGGLLIVALYRGMRNTNDKGTNTVIAALQEGAEIPFKMAPLIFISTTVTQLFGGSAGREGAALQLGGSLANKLGRLLRLQESDRRILIMCGMSAGFSALFGTPLAAAVFSMEIACVGYLQQGGLVPCVVASYSGFFIAKWLRIPPEVFPVSSVPVVSPVLLLQIVALAVVVGIVSIVFCKVLHGSEYLYDRYIKNQYLRIAVSGTLLIVLTGAVGTKAYLGSGMEIIEGIFHHGDGAWYTFLLKMVFTAVTLGAGFKGGEIVPSLTIGAALGFVCSGLLGLPGELAAACGMAGLFCGVTNCPVTALLISFELFGFEAMPCYIVCIAVSYLISGYHSLYRKQKFAWSKIKFGLVQKNTHNQ